MSTQATGLLGLLTVGAALFGFCFHVGWASFDAMQRLAAPQSPCVAELQLSKAYAQQLETMLDKQRPDVFEALAGK